MDLRVHNPVGLALAGCFIAVVVAACASPTIPDDSHADDGSGAATGEKKTPSSTKKTPSKSDSTAAANDSTNAPSAPAPAPALTTPPATQAPITNCTGLAADACFDCCNQGSGGALAPADDVFGTCACGGGQCTSVCDATLCSGAAPDAACSSCLQTTCQPAEAAACTSAACKAGLQCAQQCN